MLPSRSQIWPIFARGRSRALLSARARSRALRRLAVGSLLLGLCACGAPKPTYPAAARRDPWEGRGRECVRAFLGKDSPYAELTFRSGGEALLARVPVEARRTALAAGIEPLVASALSQASSAEPTLALLAVKQDLGLRLISLETQLAAIIFEAECTGELIEAMAYELDQGKQSRSLGLAVASLVVGAAFATGAGVWDLTGTQSIGPAVLGLSGGLAGAALGAAAFAPRARSLRFDHARNLLIPILRNDDTDQLYPAFVFRLLTLPTAEGSSPREQLLASWSALIEEGVPRSERPQATALLYGEGGLYSQELLLLRERMYDALETRLNALARDLELLDRFLVRELSRPTPAEPNSAAPDASQSNQSPPR